MTFLPEDDHEYLTSKGLLFEEKFEGGQNGLIIRNFVLPSGKFNCEQSDLLIIIPPNYPDTHPDMWYFYPRLLLLPSDALPRATESNHNFEGKTWQRWSRHLQGGEWRAGIDGIHTYLKRVEIALANAA
jgi:hypothetical protein